MIDALFPDAIPAGTTCDIIAAYIDHNENPQSFAQAVARFPNAVHLKITVQGDTAADAIDGEQGTGITPADAARWAKAKRAAGQPFLIYCNENLTDGWGWAAYRAAVSAVGIDPATVAWWTADYDDVAALRPGEWARQYWDRDALGRNTFDTSITATPWPPNGDDMSAADVAAINAHTDAAIAKILSQAEAFYDDPAHPYSNRNLLGTVQGVAAVVAKQPAGSVDVNALASALASNLGPDLAKELVAELGAVLTAASKQ